MTAPVTSRPDTGKTLLLTVAAVAAVASAPAAGLLVPQPARAQTSATAPTPDRVATLRAEQQAPRNVIPFDPARFDKFVGDYRMPQDAIFKITRDGDKFLSQLPGQPPVRVYPESDTKFFATVVAAQISFNTDAQGRVTELVLHQNGAEIHAPKISEAAAKAAEATLAKRVEEQKPSPGTADFLRRYIVSASTGHPNYDQMTPTLAAVAQDQWPTRGPIILARGALKSLTFLRVDPQGHDVYEADYEHGKLEWTVGPLDSNGKESMSGGREIP